MTTRVKMCGLKTPATIKAAVKAGVDYIGLVFLPESPRNVSVEEAAMLASRIPSHVSIVGLFVDPQGPFMDRVLEAVPLDIIQLHGQEPVEHVLQTRQRTGRQVMKAVGIREAEDLQTISHYEPVVDRLLLDAKPPKQGGMPGGNAMAFDWTLLEGKNFQKPWMLAGGLTADNIQTAIRITGAPCVDVSSGLETASGEKSPDKIARFMRAVKNL